MGIVQIQGICESTPGRDSSPARAQLRHQYGYGRVGAGISAEIRVHLPETAEQTVVGDCVMEVVVGNPT